LAVGDRFPLFAASSFSGSFSRMVLPPLPVGLAFTNKLALDGSVEVVAVVVPQPTLFIRRDVDRLFIRWPTDAGGFLLETSFDLSPPIHWQTVSNGLSDDGALRTFVLTNRPAVPQQFFRLTIGP
jgi:hypothetical protein